METKTWISEMVASRLWGQFRGRKRIVRHIHFYQMNVVFVGSIPTVNSTQACRFLYKASYGWREPHRENLRNCYGDLVRCNALYAAGIDGLYFIAIGSSTHDYAVHIDDRRVR